MSVYSEFLLLNGTILGVTFVSPLNTITPNIVPFSVSVLAVVTNKVENPHMANVKDGALAA